MAQLRRQRGQDVAEREVPRILGFDDTRATRWKEGQMYVDRAEFLVKLAVSLEVDVMLLMGLACGTLTTEHALRQAGYDPHSEGVSNPPERPVAKGKPKDIGADWAKYAITSGTTGSPCRGLVLLVSDSGDGQSDLAAVLARHSDIGGLAATALLMGMILAERHRPDLIFLDLGLAGGGAHFEACRAFSNLVGRSRRRCRVVAGARSLTDTIHASVLMAGAADATSAPFSGSLFKSEVDRLEDRLGSRRGSE